MQQPPHLLAQPKLLQAESRPGHERKDAHAAVADLAALDMPVHAWLGDHDALIGADAAPALRDMRPDMTVHALAACGHAPLLSQPRRLARELESLL